MKKTEKWMFGAFGLLAMLVLFMFGGMMGLFQFQVVPSPEPTPTDRGDCNLASAPSVTFRSIDEYSGTADTTGSAIHYRIDGGIAWTAATPGTAITSVMNAFEEYTVVFYDDSTARYGKMVSYEVPCQENPSLDVESVAVATAASMSSYTDNPDGTQNSNSNQWALGAGDVKTFTSVIGGEYETAYGNPYISGGMNVIVFEYNSTEIDEVRADLSAAPTPTQHTVSAVDHKTAAFYMDPLMSVEEARSKITVDASDTVNPTEDITWTLYDVQYFYNKYSKNVEYGVEDEYNNDVGIGTELTGTVYLS